MALRSLFIFWVTLATAAPGHEEEARFTDPRDSQSYSLVTIGGLTWFARDLNYAAEGSFCYDDDPANCSVYGRLYPWEVGLGACPPGWHMATEREWQALELALGMKASAVERERNRGTNQGGRLKPSGDTGFNVTYGGWRRSEDGRFEALGKNAAWWTATESSLERAWHRDVDTGDNFIFRSAVVKPYGLSVRCVRNPAATGGQQPAG